MVNDRDADGFAEELIDKSLSCQCLQEEVTGRAASVGKSGELQASIRS